MRSLNSFRALSGLGAALAIAAQHLPKLLEHQILVIQVLIQGEQAGVGVQQVGVEPEGLCVGRDRLGGADAVGKRDVRDRLVPEGPWRVAHALGRAGEEPQVDLAQNEVGAGVVGVGANCPPRRPQRQVEEADGTVVVPRLEVGSAPEKELVRRRRLGVLRQHGWAGQNVPRKGHRGRRQDRSVGAGRRADDAGGQRALPGRDGAIAVRPRRFLIEVLQVQLGLVREGRAGLIRPEKRVGPVGRGWFAVRPGTRSLPVVRRVEGHPVPIDRKQPGQGVGARRLRVAPGENGGVAAQIDQRPFAWEAL